jgi:uncharacterized protein (DUF58 family)
MLHRRAIALLYAATTLVVLGVMMKSWQPLVASAVALTYIGLAGLRGAPRPSLEVRHRVAQDAVARGTVAKASVRVTCVDRPADTLEVFDPLPDHCDLVRGRNGALLSIGIGEGETFSYDFIPYRLGRTRLGRLKWRSADANGMFFEEGEAKGDRSIRVLPPWEDVRHVRLRPRTARRPFGFSPARGRGRGTEFFGLRDYLPGDPRRSIMWKTSLRIGRLVCFDREDERVADVLLILDLRTPALAGTHELTTHDAVVQGAANIARRALADRHRLGIMYVRDRIAFLPPSKIRQRLLRDVEQLGLPDVDDVFPVPWLTWLVRRTYPRGAHVVALTPLLDDELVSCLARIATWNDVRVLVPNVTGPPPALGEPRATRVSREVLLLKRDVRAARLRIGCDVVFWEPADGVAAALPLLKRGQVRRRGVSAW